MTAKSPEEAYLNKTHAGEVAVAVDDITKQIMKDITVENLFNLAASQGFGAGVSDNEDEEIIPNPNMVGSNLPQHPSAYDRSYDPSNFLTTKAYGLAPSNTTLTVKYAIGGGAVSYTHLRAHET